PSMLSLNTRDELEEERRLFYVAITRAQERLYLSYSLTRVKFGSIQYNEISRFIEEVGLNNLDIQGIRPGAAAFSQRPLSTSRIEDAGDGNKPWYLRKSNIPSSSSASPKPNVAPRNDLRASEKSSLSR